MGELKYFVHSLVAGGMGGRQWEEIEINYRVSIQSALYGSMGARINRQYYECDKTNGPEQPFDVPS